MVLEIYKMAEGDNTGPAVKHSLLDILRNYPLKETSIQKLIDGGLDSFEVLDKLDFECISVVIARCDMHLVDQANFLSVVKAHKKLTDKSRNTIQKEKENYNRQGMMTEEHRELLKKHTFNLAMSMDANLLMVKLYSDNVLVRVELDACKAEPTPFDQGVALLRMVEKGPDSNIYILARALLHTNKLHLAKLLHPNIGN